MKRYFKRVIGAGSGNYIYFWNSTGLPDEKINSVTASNHIITRKAIYNGNKTKVKFIGSCLKQDKFI